MIKKAFIIDDDEISVFLTVTQLENNAFAHRIDSFTYVQPALEEINQVKDQHLPQVIFLDLNMPIQSGWDFLETLTEKQEYRLLGKCHIYVLTSSVNPEEQEFAKQFKLVSGFLHKPLSDQEILQIKHQICGKSDPV